MEVSTVLDEFDEGAMAPLRFQCGRVRTLVYLRKLLRSLYHGYPGGGLLTWHPGVDAMEER